MFLEVTLFRVATKKSENSKGHHHVWGSAILTDIHLTKASRLVEL